MFKETYVSKQIFKKGNLITLRDGIPKYPYHESIFDNLKSSLSGFIDEELLVLNVVNDESNKHVIGYECLSSIGRIYIMDMNTQHSELEVGFCFVKSHKV